MIWIIGCKGMLGTELCLLLKRERLSFLGTDKEIDITKPDVLADYKNSNKVINWIVNCSAYTAVDKAEEEQELAFKINREGVTNIAFVAKSIGAKLIHISTDYVFNGEGNRPYREDDPVDPVGVYGKSKEAGERVIRDILEEHYILRTSWLYGKYGNNFVYTMLRLLKEKDSVGVVSDQKGTPTWTHDLAVAIKKIIDTDNDAYGTYHFSGEGETTWHGFAKEIQSQALAHGILERECTINPLTTEQYPTRAKRPAYSVLSKDKIKKAFKISIAPWEKSLEEFLCKLKHKR